jgi:Arc/MetJ family transcription regulator
MLTHMRTSVEISDDLLEEARRVVAKKRTTLRALVEEGLRRVVKEGRATRPVRLPDAAFSGRKGFARGVAAEDLPKLLEEIRNSGRTDL